MKEHDTSAWEKFSQSTNCLLSSICKNIIHSPHLESHVFILKEVMFKEALSHR